MYKTIQQYANDYEPLTRTEELELLDKGLPDTELFEVFIKHNARMILKQVNKWKSTLDLDDASSCVITKLLRNFDKYDHKMSFYYFANLRITAALHEAKYKYRLDKFVELPEDYDVEDLNVIQYSDLKEQLQTILTTDEYNIIDDIYFKGKRVNDSIKLVNKSRKHSAILKKIKLSMGKMLEFDEY